MENKKQIITVPEWFWDKIDNDIRRYGWSLVVEYKESERKTDIQSFHKVQAQQETL